ncbi:MAG: arsenosugar biosynthesis radical SAM protein ArsS [Methylococcaceae bacterium]|nr:arsenosugar biosynthesis radical SAM protein ArsS [Methylococcaceae bacterium]
MHSTLTRLGITDFPRIFRGRLKTLQINLGYLCNQSCVHCHVNAGPKRTEIMDRSTIEEVIQFTLRERIASVDLTGGAPEMNPHFRDLVETLHERGIHIIDRCNLTVLEQDGYTDLAEFLAVKRVEITASLPCYLEENVDRQRGKGVFGSSLKALKKLNRLGYGQPGSELILNLVYNPQGAVLPPPQEQLQLAYRRHLKNAFGIVFNHLYTLTNMPIQRFGSLLISRGEFEPYMNLLRESYRKENLASVMCRTTLSVDWQGYVYDCDFNQMLQMSLGTPGQSKVHIRDLTVSNLENSAIHVGDHCYGCTAGQGSSCGGALAQSAAG